MSRSSSQNSRYTPSTSVSASVASSMGSDVHPIDNERDPIALSSHVSRHPILSPSGLQFLDLNSDDVKMMLSADAEPWLRRGLLRSLQQQKLQTAQARRERLKQQQLQRLELQNTRKDIVSRRALHRRSLQEVDCEERSFQLSRALRDTVVLQKVRRSSGDICILRSYMVLLHRDA